MLFCCLLFFFQNQFFFKKFFQETQIRPNVLSALIWVQTACKGYQQATLGGKELKSDLMKYAILSWAGPNMVRFFFWFTLKAPITTNVVC